MRIKLIAKAGDGKYIVPGDIQLVNAETGEPIEGVRSVELAAEPNSVCTLKLEILPSEVEIEGEPTHALLADMEPDHVCRGLYWATALTDSVHKFKPIPAPRSEDNARGNDQ